MTTKLQKWGNSLGVRLSKEVVRQAKFRSGKAVSVRTVGNTVIISGKKKETFESLVSKITPENRYDELFWGPPVGNEIW